VSRSKLLINGITFLVISAYIVAVTLLRPMETPRPMPVRPDIVLTTEPAIRWWGGAVIVATLVLYVVFW
jgi:hypothetical protein